MNLIFPASKKSIKCINNRTRALFLSKTIILTLLKLLKPIKTDTSSVVDLDSLNIMSVALLKWPFVPKQGPRSKILDKILDP